MSYSIPLEAVVSRIEVKQDGRLGVAFERSANWYFVLPETREALEDALRRSLAQAAPIALRYAVPGNVLLATNA